MRAAIESHVLTAAIDKPAAPAFNCAPCTHLPRKSTVPFMASETLVEVRGLSRFYGDVQAINNISFDICQGDVLGFLGPNGAGKTTTMQVISGNLAPSEGSVTIAGHDLLEEPRAAKAAIGYLPEQPPVYRELTVDEYLDYCAALNRIPRTQRKAARSVKRPICSSDRLSNPPTPFSMPPPLRKPAFVNIPKAHVYWRAPKKIGFSPNAGIRPARRIYPAPFIKLARRGVLLSAAASPPIIGKPGGRSQYC